MKKEPFFLLLLSSSLYILSFPPFNISVLAVISFVPLFFLTINKGIKKSSCYFFYLGVIFFTVHTHWLIFLKVEPGIKVLLFAGFLLLVLYLSLYFAIFGAVTHYIFKKTNIVFRLLLIPSLWVLLEFIRSSGTLGFPWSPLWLSQIGNLSFAQSVSLVGPYGLSWIIIFLNVAIFNLLTIDKHRWALLTVTTGIILSFTLYGSIRLKGSTEGESVEISLLQPNVASEYIYYEDEWSDLESAYGEIIPQIESSSQLIVLPETALPGYYKHSSRGKEFIMDLFSSLKSYILFGNADYEITQEVNIYNSAFLLSPERDIVGQYRKNHLVPFGEWIPFENKLKFLSRIDLGEGDYTPSEELTPLSFPGVNLGVLICFEAIFPEITRKYVKSGVDILVNITSDGWFGRSLGPREHMELARFRAIESGRYLLRSAKTGISAIIDPTGRILEKLPLFERGAINYRVTLSRDNTLYVRIGDVIVIASSLILLLFGVYNYVEVKRTR